MKVENAVTVEPVGEFELKGIRRPQAAYLPLYRPKFESGIIEAKAVELSQSARLMVPGQEKG